MLAREALRLRTGEQAYLECYRPDGSPPPESADALWDMVVRPREPWFSRAETEFFTRMLRGRLAQTNADILYAVWIDGRPAAHVAITRAADCHEIGLVGYVLTEPAFRGRGLCSLLMERVMDDFKKEGGACAVLGTGNPTAHAIYARHGFRDYNGHVMRYLAEPALAETFDHLYYAYHGPATVRAGHWGDAARIGWLYAVPSDWFVKDYAEALYDHPAIVHMRCGSILPSMMLNVEERAGGLWVLETAEKRVVGAATMTVRDTVAQSKAPILDFWIVPAYREQAGALLRVAVEAAARAGAEAVRAYLASCDREKAEIVQGLAFRLEATLASQFSAGDSRYDLNVYALEL